ncbi:hypothetical protein B0T11DRAFT_122610 [Plectosphaerella cucumerina]|uniref:DUF7580 domain-containing protein n=1 Tax=Plectosphaerella cucumerina TaxID=40658 RepID=A0A8K0T8V6_9PEZI|nr:hypothetical protein B0T11DRAFT_122610 [Plectosphaerella cucumerina]
MSGFEIAGLVLGAFPLAILALEKHREVATRLGLFYKIKLEHKKCMDDLVYQQLYLKRHLRKLILPLKVNYDDAKINELLADPDGPGWKDATVSAMFEERLQDSYELYLSYIQSIKETMDRLNHELAADSDTIQDQVQPSAGKIRVRSQESRQFQRYRIKFSNGEAVRNRLFSELQEYNAKLEQLLESSDKDASLVRQTTGARTTVMDATLCTFWIQAAKVFRALVTAWTCQCRQQHCAKLQLQHRTTKKKPEFNILFETEGLEPLPWEKRRAKISEGADQVAAIFETRTAVVPQRSLPLRGPSPTRRTAPPPKSALKAQGPKKSNAVGFLVPPPPAITVTHVQAAAQLGRNTKITSLCSSLSQLEKDCCGYLSDDDCRYYVYSEVCESHGWQTHVTLEDILKGHTKPRPSRRQRYAISLIVASSFVQLLETPWLPDSLSKSDILFFQDDSREGFKLDQPHVTRRFVDRVLVSDGSQPTNLSRSLEELGILLLELCFGSALEDQPYRKAYREADGDERMRRGCNLLAARDWLADVEEEAGIGYSEAIAWCLKGNHSAQGTSGKGWREEMLRSVIQPLQSCTDF